VKNWAKNFLRLQLPIIEQISEPNRVGRWVGSKK